QPYQSSCSSAFRLKVSPEGKILCFQLSADIVIMRFSMLNKCYFIRNFSIGKFTYFTVLDI
ncbi:hypothetical protein, partial [uncultured Bacteroides sp.]|uniref:hypothetical protein n=1 Tax=uncultured Bacteroides sp. TaxID=162156 RepID=UPI0025FB0ACD